MRELHVLEMRPAHEYAYEAGRQKLEDLLRDIDEDIQNQQLFRAQLTFIVPGDDDADQRSLASLDPGLSARKGRTLRLSSIVDLESKVSIGCAGAVLMYLQRRKASRYLPRESDAATIFRVSAIQSFSLEDVM